MGVNGKNGNRCTKLQIVEPCLVARTHCPQAHRWVQQQTQQQKHDTPPIFTTSLFSRAVARCRERAQYAHSQFVRHVPRTLWRAEMQLYQHGVASSRVHIVRAGVRLTRSDVVVEATLSVQRKARPSPGLQSKYQRSLRC